MSAISKNSEQLRLLLCWRRYELRFYMLLLTWEKVLKRTMAIWEFC